MEPNLCPLMEALMSERALSATLDVVVHRDVSPTIMYRYSLGGLALSYESVVRWVSLKWRAAWPI